MSRAERARAAVERGAALLSEQMPRWEKEIDVDRLAIYDGECCVLGQVYGEYGDGLQALGLDSMAGAAEHGFDSEIGMILHARQDLGVPEDEMTDHQALQQAWIALLEERKTQP